MDEFLISKAQSGDKEGFTAAIYRVKDKAYRVAYCYMNEQQDSIDAVHNAIEKAFKNFKHLKNASYFSTWFIRIVINECKLFLRKKKKNNLLLQDLYQKNFTSIGTVEENIDLNMLLSNLPENDRALINMKFYLGFTLDEISDLTNLPLGTVKSKIYNNLKKMKEKLEIKECR